MKQTLFLQPIHNTQCIGNSLMCSMQNQKSPTETTQINGNAYDENLHQMQINCTKRSHKSVAFKKIYSLL